MACGSCRCRPRRSRRASLGALASGTSSATPPWRRTAAPSPAGWDCSPRNCSSPGPPRCCSPSSPWGCDAEVLYIVYGRSSRSSRGTGSLTASWSGWSSAAPGPVRWRPSVPVHDGRTGRRPRRTRARRAPSCTRPCRPAVRLAADFPVRMHEVFLLQWPFEGERYLLAAARILAQPVGAAMALPLAALLCAQCSRRCAPGSTDDGPHRFWYPCAHNSPQASFLSEDKASIATGERSPFRVLFTKDLGGSWRRRRQRIREYPCAHHDDRRPPCRLRSGRPGKLDRYPHAEAPVADRVGALLALGHRGPGAGPRGPEGHGQPRGADLHGPTRVQQLGTDDRLRRPGGRPPARAWRRPASV